MKIVLVLMSFFSNNAVSEVYTWSKAIRKAQNDNPSLFQAVKQVDSSEFLVKSTRSSYFPSLAAKLNYMESDQHNDSDHVKKYNVNLELRQNLFAGLRDISLVDEYKSKADVTRSLYQGTKAQISYDLKRTYADLYFAQESIKLAKELLQRRQDNLRLVKLRYEGGKENHGSVLMAKAALEQASFDLLEVEQAISVAKKDFIRVLGIDDEEDISVKGEIPELNLGEQINLEQLITQLPDFQKLNSQVAITEFQLRQTKSTFLPTLDLVTSVGKTDANFYPENESWSIGLNLNFPLFDGGRDYYATESKVANINAAKAELINYKREARVSLQKAFYHYRLMKQKLIVDTAYMEAILVRSKIAQEKYNNGLMSFEDWYIIENDLTTRRKNYILAKKNKILAEASWELAQGHGVIK